MVADLHSNSLKSDGHCIRGELPMAHAIPILLYHRIDTSGLPTATTPEAFRRHLQWLYERGWRTLDAETFTHYLRTGRALPPHAFVITFDDGYESIASAAFPVLQTFRYTAISFLSTGLMRNARGGRPAHPDASRHGSLYLSWEQVRALQSCGVVSFQSHTHTHGRFEERGIDALAADLDLSRQMLVQELGLPASHFEHLAWPWGYSTPAWRTLAKKNGFRYQYTVARQSFLRHMPCDTIPRTCFDATAFTAFQAQFRLQSGALAQLWNLAYPVGRRLRHLTGI